MAGKFGTARQAFEYFEDIDGYRSSKPSPTKKIDGKTFYLYWETPYKTGAERRARDLRRMGYAARITDGVKSQMGYEYEKEWKKLYFVWAGNQ